MDSIKKRNMNTDENNLFIFDCPAVPVSGILQESEVWERPSGSDSYFGAIAGRFACEMDSGRFEGKQ